MVLNEQQEDFLRNWVRDNRDRINGEFDISDASHLSNEDFDIVKDMNFNNLSDIADDMDSFIKRELENPTELKDIKEEVIYY